MKKIGILTFHQANNYGAVLQAFALSKIISFLNKDVVIIDYRNKCLSNVYSLFPKSGNRVISFIKSIIKLYWTYHNNKNFDRFRNKFLPLSVKYTKTNLEKIVDNFDLFIVGSDQVWNFDLTKGDTSYFLDFVSEKNKKISYAASIGKITLTKTEEKTIAYLLSDFMSISVREKSAKTILENLLRKNIVVLIDPTFLLSVNQWKELLIFPKEDNYIVLYLMTLKDDKIIKFAKKLAKTKKMKLIYISISPRRITGATNIIVPPEKFLGYIYKAKYVITNSFHGLCFCIKFNKSFFVNLPVMSQKNTRLSNLLDLTNLRERLIDNIGTNYDKPINWDSVNKVIEQERENSTNYLKNVISG